MANLGSNPLFDMDAQGKRAVVLMNAEGDAPKPETHIRVMLNLGDELRRRIEDMMNGSIQSTGVVIKRSSFVKP